jgi:quinoprotein glucose dehydrogenase
MKVRSVAVTRSIVALTAVSLLMASSPSALLAQGAPAAANVDWRTYEGGNHAQSYSPLDQINLDSIKNLEVVWTHTLDAGASQSSPLVVDTTMFLIGANNALVALNAETGQQLWSRPAALTGRSRGITYWESKDRKDRRIITFNDQMMEATDALTGKLVPTFGAAGKVDLRLGFNGRTLEQVPRIQPSSPGRVVGDIIIIGSATGEAYGSPPGDIRAYNIRTGKQVWAFHTIPQPGEYGYNEWKPDLWKTASSANNWGGMAVDEKRGIAYVPLGSASYDFWGVDRPGSNLFANSLVALDVKTGKRLWHFQTVHHDLWDYDLTTTPVLMTIDHAGKKVDVVVQAAKTGFLFVFDRVTGKPMWPIEERPVPKSNVPGEVAWPTQPFVTVVPPFAKQSMTADDIDPRLPHEEYVALQARVRAARNEGLFTPPEMDRETVQMPGNHGGANWGMNGAEPNSSRYYVASFDQAALLKLELTTGQPRTTGLSPISAGEALYKANCQVCHGADREGTGGIPELKDIAKRYKPAEIKTIISDGRATMPAFGGTLSSANLDNVVAYLTGLAPRPQPQQGPGQQNTALSPEAALAASRDDDQPASGEYQELKYHSPYGFFNASLGNPATKPPWSTLTAYDLSVPKILWQKPIGTVPWYSNQPTGTAQSKGGILITAGGLIFSSSNSDRRIHAWNKDTGDLVWQGDLPSAGQGRPITYMINGRQYLAVPAAGSNPLQPNSPAGRWYATSPPKNSFVVYALKK